jgi:hypothetical protein
VVSESSLGRSSHHLAVDGAGCVSVTSVQCLVRGTQRGIAAVILAHAHISTTDQVGIDARAHGSRIRSVLPIRETVCAAWHAPARPHGSQVGWRHGQRLRGHATRRPCVGCLRPRRGRALSDIAFDVTSTPHDGHWGDRISRCDRRL